MMMFVTPTTPIVISCGHYEGTKSVIKKTWHLHTDTEGNLLPVLRETVEVDPVAPTEIKPEDQEVAQ